MIQAFLLGEFLAKPVWVWVLFICIVITLLAFDLGVLHKDDREIGVRESLWLSAGYNRVGFSADRDLAGYEYTQRGAYVRLRFKFDETLFDGGDPAVNRSLPR